MGALEHQNRKRRPERNRAWVFETPGWLAALAAVALVVVSIASFWQAVSSTKTQAALIAAQNEILTAANRPAFIIQQSQASDSQTGSRSLLTVTNQGAPVEAFSVHVTTYVRLASSLKDTGFEPATLRLEGYYDIEGGVPGSGVLYSSNGFRGGGNDQVLLNAVDSLEAGFGQPERTLIARVDTYLFITYTDRLGVEQQLAYVVDSFGSPRRLVEDETQSVRDALSASLDDSRCTISCILPPSPEQLLEAYDEAVRSQPYADLPH